MPKNIVILCDGTSNEISSNRTNILRLYGCLKKDDTQIVFYDPGVGTFGSEAALLTSLWRKATEIWQLATGFGIDRNVLEAYRFLLDHYDPGDPDDPTTRDRIYILGFSRGAYTARVLAGFIHAVGLIDKTQLNLLSYAYRAFKRVGEPNDADETGGRENKAFAEVRLYERTLRPDRPVIRCLGLFDTVSSVIEWDSLRPRLRSHAFTRMNRSVEAVRHAVALHERRVMFRPQLWPEEQPYWSERFDEKSARPQDAREVWFNGVHGDVGGGYPEERSALAKLPLYWMIQETEGLGLQFKPDIVDLIVLGKNPDKHYVTPDGSQDPQVSMKGAWPALEFVPLPPAKGYGKGWLSAIGLHLPLFQDRVVPQKARIHNSVTEGGSALPDNVPEDHRVE